MDTKHIRQSRLVSRLALVFAASLVITSSWPSSEAQASACLVEDAAGSSYPALSDNVGPDIGGQSSVLLYLDVDHALIDIDGCLHTVDRSAEIDFEGLDVVVAKLQLPTSTAGWTLFVTRDGVWTETIDSSSSGVLVMLWPDSTVGLELAPPEQLRPIKPLVVLGPAPQNPTP